MQELLIKNAQLVLASSVVYGHVLVRDGVIAEIASGATSVAGEDLQGDFLIPGLVELHTDHLEQHFHPRPGVTWPAILAVIAHDAQIAASGITTVFDALRAGTFDPQDLSAKYAVDLRHAIGTAQAAGLLRAAHFVHIRCEMPCRDTIDAAEAIIAAGQVHLISIMDHTPGARQFVSMDKFKEYYLGRKLIAADKIDAYIAERRDMQASHAARNKAMILALAKQQDITLASHDDATANHVSEAVADGVAIAEFPTTREAASAAHRQGLSVLMGAPNVVRGGSHSGNISATEVAASGTLDVLSSDYVPASLLNAVFSLPHQVEGLALPDALRFVTKNPARAAGLDDRGEIVEGKRADLVQVAAASHHPVVRCVWRQGQRVM
jgi:alpha-D-ribose 1-methylphosphonate 5-triphosphate diphosphatase